VHLARPGLEFLREALGIPKCTPECDPLCLGGILVWFLPHSHICGVELLLNPSLESIPSGDGVESSFDVVTPAVPSNKGYVFKRERSVAHLLAIVLHASYLEADLKSKQWDATTL